MFIPTRRFWILAALSIPIAAIGAMAGSYALGWVYDCLLVLAGLISGLMGPTEKSLSIKRTHDVVLSVRASNRIVLELENLTAGDLEFDLRDEPPDGFIAPDRNFHCVIPAGRIKEVEYQATPPERGDLKFRGTFVRFVCPFGLVVKQIDYDLQSEVRVYPNILAIRDFELLRQKGKLRDIGVRRSRIRGLGGDFESLRDYALGDDFRKIDWKATARRGKPIVKVFETERNQSVVLCLDIGRHMIGEVEGVTKLDHSVDSALVLARAAVSMGDQVGLLVYSDVVERFIPPGKGRNRLGALVEALHDLVALPIESNPNRAMAYLSARWKRRSLVVFFTDGGDGDRAKLLVSALKPLVRRHLVLVVRVADPELRQAMDDTIESPKTLFRRAGALYLESDRRAAETVLRGAGFSSVEAEPQELTARLVSFYFDAKDRALI